MALSREQIIQELRFISQELKIEAFETAALAELQLAYEKARDITAQRIAAASARVLSDDAPTRMLQEAAIKRLQDLYAETDAMVEALAESITDDVAQATGEVGAYSYTDTNDILSWSGNVEGYDNVSMTANQIANLARTQDIGGRTLNEWMFSAFKGEHESIYDEVIADIRAGRMTGTGYKGIMDNLKNRYANYMDNPEVARNIETVAISYLQTANAKAHDDIFSANDEVIKEVEWSAIMEGGNTSTGRGTCPRCAALDGNRYPSIEEGPNRPLHPRCRCLYMPITKSWEELGIIEGDLPENKWKANRIVAERDLEAANYLTNQRIDLLNNELVTIEGEGNKYGSVAADTTYADYWAKQPEPWQDNAIGPVRAELVRDGMIGFNDIVDSNGDLIPIKKLTLKSGKKSTTGGTIVPKGAAPPKSTPAPKPDPYPVPRVTTGLVKDDIELPYGSDFKDSYSKKFAAGVPDELKADYQDYFMSTDVLVATVSKGRGKKPDHYLPASGDIKMSLSKAGQARAGTTFVHEFGHRTDHKWGSYFNKKWGESTTAFPGKKMVSTSRLYDDAVNADKAFISEISSKSLRSLGGATIENQPTRVALTKAMLAAESDFDSRFTGTIEENIASLKKGKVIEKYKYLDDHTNSLVLDYKKNSKGAFYDSYALKAEYKMRRSVALASETGAESFILRGYLDASLELYTNKDGARSMLLLNDAIGSTSLLEYGMGHDYGYLTKQSGWAQNLESFGNIFALNGNPTYKRFFKDYTPNQSKQFDAFIDEVKEFENDDY